MEAAVRSLFGRLANRYRWLREGITTISTLFRLNNGYNLYSKITDLERGKAFLVKELASIISQSADRRAVARPIEECVKRKALKQALETHKDQPPALAWKPADRPAVSIVLGTYNRLPILKKVIKSIRNNGICVPYEIIVIDGGSPDGTAEWLFTQRDIISIVHHNRADGTRLRSWGWFMNIGFRSAHAPYILMISDDCLLVPGAVEAGLARLAEAQQTRPSIGGVAFYFRNWPAEKNYYVQKTVGGMLMVNHGIFVRDALEAVGFCEEEAYCFYKCDSDLSLKLWHANYDIIDCRGAFVEHLLLPTEAIRLNNSETMARDRWSLHERWEGVYTHRSFPGMFNLPSRLEISYEDPWNTAETFLEFVSKSHGDEVLSQGEQHEG